MDGRGGLFIGNDVSISIYTKIISASHRPSDFSYFENSVLIKDHVWTGCAAIILDGSQLNDNSIVGAGCVFKGIANKNGIYIGNPAYKIKDREMGSIPYKILYDPYFR